MLVMVYAKRHIKSHCKVANRMDYNPGIPVIKRGFCGQLSYVVVNMDLPTCAINVFCASDVHVRDVDMTYDFHLFFRNAENFYGYFP